MPVAGSSCRDKPAVSWCRAKGECAWANFIAGALGEPAAQRTEEVRGEVIERLAEAAECAGSGAPRHLPQAPTYSLRADQ